MKKIISVFIVILSFTFISNIVAEEYEEYHSGDLVRYNDIAFYVLFDSDSNEESVQLLKMAPLTHDEINRYTDNKAGFYILYNNNLEYRKSDEKYAYGNMSFYYGDNCYYKSGNSVNGWFNEVSTGCLNDYELSNVKKVVDAWTEENISDDDISPLEDGYNARLLKINEISYFDSNIDFSNNSSEYNISDFPKWLNKINHNGWTMDGHEYCSYYYGGVIASCQKNVYAFTISTGIINQYHLKSINVLANGSVRPTMKLKKNAISKVSYNEYHNNQVREYKIGDIINYNDTSFYVIKNSSEDDNVITLLKKEPLTRYELEKYGAGYINNYINRYNGNNVEQGKPIFDNGLYKVAFLSTSDCYSLYTNNNSTYDVSGCNYDYNVSNVKHIVDNWLTDTISEDDIAKDSTGYYSRLINSDDLNDLGYVGIQANTTGQENFKISNDTPKFMTDDNTKGMLTMILGYAYSNGGTSVQYGITVADDGYSFITRGIPSDSIGTVRPVITINKKEITPKITNVEEIEDSEDDNVIINIESDVNNDMVVNVPNTLLRNIIVISIVGVIVCITSIIIFIYFKKK